MQELWAYIHEFNALSVALRLVLAMICGGMIGMERAQKRRPAGFRTYMLVCLGAALTMLLSQYEFEMINTHWADVAQELGIKTDVSRFGAQVINGIGFLGAGTILVSGNQQIKGLTTAAALWASACMGLSIGAGFYECVIPAFVIIALCVCVFPIIDNYIQENSRIMNIFVEFDRIDDIGVIVGRLKEMNLKVFDFELERGQKKSYTFPSAFFSADLPNKQSHGEVLSSLADLECIRIVKEL